MKKNKIMGERNYIDEEVLDERPELLILVGPSASGKSTFARSLVTSSNNRIIISRDAFRKALYGYTDADLSAHYTSKAFGRREKIVTRVINDTLVACYDTGQDVVLDATHLSMKYLNKFTTSTMEKSFKIKIKLFDLDQKTCIQRDQQREAMVGKSIIKRQFEQLKKLLNNMDFIQLVKEFPYEN